MSIVETAERKSRLRAIIFYLLALGLTTVLWLGLGANEPEQMRVLWATFAGASATILLPLARWLKPGNAVARLLEDESTSQNRRTGIVAGFWASAATGVILAGATEEEFGTLSASATARIIFTLAIAIALATFATLELRAARD